MTDLDRIYQNGWKAALAGRDDYSALEGRELNAWLQGWRDGSLAVKRRNARKAVKPDE